MVAGFKFKDFIPKDSTESNENTPQVSTSERVDVLINALKDKKRIVRWKAAMDLKYLAAANGVRDQRAVDALIIALKDENVDVRNAASVALGVFQDQRAVEPLISALKDKEVEVCINAARSLGALKASQAVRPLVDAAFRLESLDAKTQVAIVLGEINDLKIVDYLVTSLKDRDKNVRLTAVVILGELQDGRRIGPLIDILKDDDVEVRRAAVEVLETIKDPRTIEPLINRLGDKDARIRQEVASALGQLRDARAVKPLILLLKDEDFEVRCAAESALRNIGDIQQIDILISSLNDSSPIFKRHVIWLLKWLSKEHLDVRAVEPLANYLKENDPHVQEEIIEALALLGSHEAIEPLTNLLKNENSIIALKAAWALKIIKDKEAKKEAKDGENKEELLKLLERVEKKFKDRRLTVAMTSTDDILVLGGYKDTLAIPILCEIVEKYSDNLTPRQNKKMIIKNKAVGCPFEIFNPAETRQNALKSLELIGDELALPWIKKALDDPQFNVRWCAANILFETWKLKDEVAPLFIKVATETDLEKAGFDEGQVKVALKVLSQISSAETNSALKKASVNGPTQAIRDEARRYLGI
ncbi:MAG: HEAT repeat domain-containing protein [bacterium]